MSSELLISSDNKSSLDPMIMVLNASQMENEKIEANSTILRSYMSKSHQPIIPYKVYGERNELRAMEYNNGCECGLGIKGEARKNETTSRIVHGYEPENRPWMIYINITVIFPNNHYFKSL